MSDKENYIPPKERNEKNINNLLLTDHIYYSKHQLFQELTNEEIDSIEAKYLDENGYLNPPF